MHDDFSLMNFSLRRCRNDLKAGKLAADTCGLQKNSPGGVSLEEVRDTTKNAGRLRLR
jgi:hypothetical protein